MWDTRYKGVLREVNGNQIDKIAESLYQDYGLCENGLSEYKFERIVNRVIDEEDRYISHYNKVFGVSDIVEMIGVFLHAPIEESLDCGQHYFIKALAILDRRCGKRRLEKYASWNYTSFPEWLRRIYQIRFEAEGIPYNKHYAIGKNIVKVGE